MALPRLFDSESALHLQWPIRRERRVPVPVVEAAQAPSLAAPLGSAFVTVVRATVEGSNIAAQQATRSVNSNLLGAYFALVKTNLTELEGVRLGALREVQKLHGSDRAELLESLRQSVATEMAGLITTFRQAEAQNARESYFALGDECARLAERCQRFAEHFLELAR